MYINNIDMIKIYNHISGQMVKKGKGQVLRFDYITVTDGYEFGEVFLNIECSTDSVYKDSFVSAKLPSKEALTLARLLTEQVRENERKFRLCQQDPK